MAERLYHVVIVNDRTREIIALTVEPEEHAAAVRLMDSFSPRRSKDARLMLQEVATPTTDVEFARFLLRNANARYTTALDGAGPARRGWFITRGAKSDCWLGSTVAQAVAALTHSERQVGLQDLPAKFVRIGTDGARLVIWATGPTEEACDQDLKDQAADVGADVDIGDTALLVVPSFLDTENVAVENRSGLAIKTTKNATCVACLATGDTITL